MPENIRALIVILILATFLFYYAKKTAYSIIGVESFARRRNLWINLTLAVFLLPNFWLFTFVTALLLIYANKRDQNPAALFFSVMFVLPVGTIQIPGMGLMNFFFELSYLRILALVVLLPVFLSLRRKDNTLSFGRCWPDRALIAYLVLNFILSLIREDSVTNSLRQLFYFFIDIFLPYYVISRSLRSMQIFRETIFSFILAILLVAAIATAEFFKQWILYASPIQNFNLVALAGDYLGRDGIIRASSAAGHALALGYLMAVGIGLYFFIQRYFQKKFIRLSGMALLAAGLIAPLSRGPWLGTAFLLIMFIMTGRFALRRSVKVFLAAFLAFTIVAALPGGERVVNLLPFIGKTETENISYRENLISNSMIVINRNFWFGSIDYLKTPELQKMRQGQGIIDLVNNYIQVTLATGVVGLGLFISFFALTLLGIYKAMRSINDRDSEEYLLGRTLLATLLAILFIIFTVSNITIIPIVYWSVSALGVAYAHMVRKILQPA